MGFLPDFLQIIPLINFFSINEFPSPLLLFQGTQATGYSGTQNSFYQISFIKNLQSTLITRSI